MLRIYQLRYKGPESFFGPKRGFILTVQSNNSTNPTSSDIKKALEAAGFRNVNIDWCQLHCWE